MPRHIINLGSDVLGEFPGDSTEGSASIAETREIGAVALNGAVPDGYPEFDEWGDFHGVDVRAEQIPDPRSIKGYTTHPTGW